MGVSIALVFGAETLVLLAFLICVVDLFAGKGRIAGRIALKWWRWRERASEGSVIIESDHEKRLEVTRRWQ